MEILEAVKGRRSINFFDPARGLDDAKLRELLELANLSPSSVNLQPWRVIAVRSPEKKKMLRGLAFNQPKVEEASAVLIVIADPMAVEGNQEMVIKSFVELGYLKPEMAEGYKKVTGAYGTPESLKRKLFAVKNTAFFAMSVMLAARGLGLETHPMDGFDEAGVKKAFSIGEDKIVPLLIGVGYLKPGTKLLPRAFRRRLDDFVQFV
ncbi:MAG: nitroreductase family protein [Elusimicrobia bacterium]|nr:nitroreductase family protein [Elusimicrobiota bacterium]